MLFNYRGASIDGSICGDSLMIMNFGADLSSLLLLFSPPFPGGRFCSFSPCIEQSQRCCEALRAHKFIEIQTMEVLQMEHVVKQKQLPVLDLDFVKQKKVRRGPFDQSLSLFLSLPPPCPHSN